MPNNVKNTALIGLLDLLAPHSCRGCGRIGSILCNCCKNNLIHNHQNLCPKCKNQNPTGNCKNCKNLPPTYTIGERTDLLGTLIHDYKYHSVRAIAKPLAEILSATLPKFENEVVIIPLPTISKHIRTRGFDHTYLIAKQFAKLHGKNYQVQKIILRNKNTVQVGTNRQNRITQAELAYKINPKININQDTTYLLLDDVWTTGASLLSALKKLQASGAKNINLIPLTVSRIK